MWVIVIQEYVLEYWAYRLLFAAGFLGQPTKASCCTLPVGPFLLHLFLIRVLHDFALSRFQKGGNSRLNVNKISFPLVRHSQLLRPRSAVNLPGCLHCVKLCAGKKDINPDSVTIWREVKMSCTPFNGIMNDLSVIISILKLDFHVEALVCAALLIHFKDDFSRYLCWHCCKHLVCISCISSVMLYFVVPSFGPGVCRHRPWFLLLPQPSKTKYSRFVALSEYIPPAKIHRPCFLNLAQ